MITGPFCFLNSFQVNVLSVSDEGQENGVSELDQTVDDEEEEEDSEPAQKKYRTKFDWEGVMHKVIKKKGEISVKKLRKKVGLQRK